MGVGSVGREVVGFCAVCKPLLNAVDHAADHGEGDLWSIKDTSSISILGSDYLTSAKLLVRHHYILGLVLLAPSWHGNAED